MERFSVVDDYVLRGGAPSEEDLEMLKEIWGVKNILSLDDSVAKRIHNKVIDLGLNHIIFPIDNIEGIEDLSENIRYLLQIPQNACEECGAEPGVNIDCSLCDQHGRTFVHCYYGKDRTGLAVALYRKACGWEAEKALEEALSFGMGVGLPKKVSDAYEAMVVNKDSSEADDAVTLIRKEVISPGMPPTNYGMNSFGPYVDSYPMIRNSFIKSAYVFGKEKQINKYAEVKIIDDFFNVADFLKAMEEGCKGIKFLDRTIIIDPRGLADSNDAIQVGERVNYDGLSQLSHPGSGGVAFDYGGMGGYVQLPALNI